MSSFSKRLDAQLNEILNMSKKVVQEAVGHVGIFWYDPNTYEIYDFAQKVTRVELRPDGFKDGPYDHFDPDIWRNMQRIRPDLEDLEYMEFPRGRVIGLPRKMGQPQKFHVVLDPGQLKNNALKNNILGRFYLPRKTTEFKGDIHYMMEVPAYEWEY